MLLVDHGSLYPAPKRLEAKRFIQATWGVSDNNRKARFYKLTKKPRWAAGGLIVREAAVLAMVGLANRHTGGVGTRPTRRESVVRCSPPWTR